jgi:short chain dehydrogenase
VTTVLDKMDLSGKVAIVTGGSRGIGRSIVQAFAEAGADVLIASRKLDACEAAAGEVRASTGRAALPVATHVGRWDDCDRLIDATLERFGRLDVLVNNAGMSPLYESLSAVTEELYDKTLSVNLKGPFRSGRWPAPSSGSTAASPGRSSAEGAQHEVRHVGGDLVDGLVAALCEGPGHHRARELVDELRVAVRIAAGQLAGRTSLSDGVRKRLQHEAGRRRHLVGKAAQHRRHRREEPGPGSAPRVAGGLDDLVDPGAHLAGGAVGPGDSGSDTGAGPGVLVLHEHEEQLVLAGEVPVEGAGGQPRLPEQQLHLEPVVARPVEDDSGGPHELGSLVDRHVP